MRITAVNLYPISSLSKFFSSNSPLSLIVTSFKAKILSKIMSVAPSEQPAIADTKVKVPRVKKNKFAVLFGYCGSGYHGLQRNPGFQTIEEEFLKACLAKKFITEHEFNNLPAIYFQRAARTDKGVSAAVQVLSLNLPTEAASSLATELNEVLPPKIRIYGAIKTTKYFDAKNYCCGRSYSYLLPTFAIAPPESRTEESFRASPQLIEEFNKVLAYYRGTHNFHNFTSGKECTDSSSMRYILSIEAGQPFIRDGLEFVVIRLRGQSFMLHQIRKMVGMAIAVMKGFATIKQLETAFSLNKMNVPRAPGLGLMLEDVHYERYNKKFGGNGIHEMLSWSRWAEQVAEFKEKNIYPLMVETEKNEKSMLNWLPVLVLHTFDTVKDENEKDKTALGEALIKAAPEKLKRILAIDRARDPSEINISEDGPAEIVEDGPSDIVEQDDELKESETPLDAEESDDETNVRKKRKM